MHKSVVLLADLLNTRKPHICVRVHDGCEIIIVINASILMIAA